MDAFNSRLYHKVTISSRKECDKLSNMAYFVTTIEETLAERLVRLFRDNIWIIYGSFTGYWRMWYQIKNYSLQQS